MPVLKFYGTQGPSGYSKKVIGVVWNKLLGIAKAAVKKVCGG
jgi:hypothetical protein